MELLLPVLALAIAAGSFVVSYMAYRRTGKANAVDNEFTDVKWDVNLEATGEDQIKLVLKNVGKTEARDVRLEAKRSSEGASDDFDFPVLIAKRIPPSGTRDVVSQRTMSQATIDPYYKLFVDPYLTWHVTWTSPLGTRSNYSHNGMQLF